MNPQPRKDSLGSLFFLCFDNFVKLALLRSRSLPGTAYPRRSGECTDVNLKL